MNIGENIKRFRNKRGLTQKELAKSIGVTTTTIQNYENNRRKPKIETLNNIAKILRVNIDSLTSNYSFSYELLISLIKVLHTENYFNFIEEKSGVPKSILSELVSKKSDDINVDYQIKMLELLFSANKAEFEKLYLDIFLFNNLSVTVNSIVKNFMMNKLNTTMKIYSHDELKQKSNNYNDKLFHDFKIYLNAFFEDRKKLLSPKEIDIIYNIFNLILNIIDSNIISLKEESGYFYAGDDIIEILLTLNKKIADLLESEFYKFDKNKRTT